MRTRIALVLLTTVCLASCGGPSGDAWSPVDANALSDAQKAQQAKGLAAQKALFGGLIGRLSAALGDGPASAIHVCKAAAPEVTATAAAEHGVRIGRTSHRLRNPANAAPAWAKRYVARRADKPVWLAHEDGRLAGLLPIPTMSLCLACHGPWKDIEQPVRTALAEHYPEDRAHGFQPGDIRGWFWIEVPAP